MKPAVWHRKQPPLIAMTEPVRSPHVSNFPTVKRKAGKARSWQAQSRNNPRVGTGCMGRRKRRAVQLQKTGSAVPELRLRWTLDEGHGKPSRRFAAAFGPDLHRMLEDSDNA